MSASAQTYEYRFICPLPNGIHARPASCLEQAILRFKSQVFITNLNNRKDANARSVLSLVGADIKIGDECILRVAGEDAADAYQEIIRFLQTEFPACDDALPAIADSPNEVYIPPVLRTAQVPISPAKPIVAGFGRGHIIFAAAIELPESLAGLKITDPRQEIQKIEKAVTSLKDEMSQKLNSGDLSATETDILKAHLSIAGDTELLEKIYKIIEEQKVCAGKAIIEAMGYFSSILKQAQSKLIRERIVDLKDVCSQLFQNIYNTSVLGRITLTRPSVCIADDLTPSQFIAMDKNLLSGLVLQNGATTSHTAILARSFGIPTLTDLRNTEQLKDGQDVIIDANYGLLIGCINDRVERFYVSEQHKKDRQQQRLLTFKDKVAKTQDGIAVEVMANVSVAQEVQAAIQNGADGIGLFRTEMLFMGRNTPPDEQEQFEEYKQAAIYADKRPVIIRTFDLGGDKLVPYLDFTRQEAAFPGFRGVCIYKQYEELFRTQLRAILRASAFGNLKIMIPMVTCLEEVKYVRDLLEQVKAELKSGAVDFNSDISLGIMVEIPSVIPVIPQLANLIEFLSIGTNDLTQYHLAIDRCDKKINSLYLAHHPSVLALIKETIDLAHAHRLWTGICGELAGQLEYLPLLLGTGTNEVSMSIPNIMTIKAQCQEFDSRRCRKILEQAVQSQTPEQVDLILKEQNSQAHEKAVIDVQLIDLDSDCLNREEAIKYISDMLYTDQRTLDPVELEKEFWRREKVYSTGLGFGFAIPHCKTTHIRSNSICFLRLKQPVAWASIDDKPVDTIIGMTIRDADQAANTHMKIFSQLARSIMHADFRQQLKDIRDKTEIVDYLYKKLQLKD